MSTNANMFCEAFKVYPQRCARDGQEAMSKSVMMGFVLPEQSAAPCVSSMHLLGERDTQREKNTEKKERQKDRQKKRKEER